MLFLMIIYFLVMVLVSVAFLTLMERKFLSYIQIRKGPNKLGLMGLIQPFSDAIKLLFKETIDIKKSNNLIYLMSPMLSFILILLIWMIYPFYVNYLSMKLSLIYLMCCFSISVYGMLMAGWASNSLFSMLGSIRSLAQSISYEVSLAIILIISMFMIDSFNFNNLINYQNYVGFFFMWPLMLMFFFSILAELNRTPFDFSEGESELVSGFNVEYMSVGFILIFLSEYASILFLSFLFSMLYLGGGFGEVLFYLKMMILVTLIIWIRGTLPRFRYDYLMYLCWLMVLPISLNIMIFMIIFKMFI